MQSLKSVRIWSFSGLYYPAFALNTDQKNYEYGHFSRSDRCWLSLDFFQPLIQTPLQIKTDLRLVTHYAPQLSKDFY